MNMNKPRYVVEYQGYTTGRDGGYPETKYLIFDTLERLVRSGTLDQHEDCVLSVMYRAEKDVLEDLMLEKKREFERIQAEQRKKDEAEFNRLKQKLGK